MTIAVLARCTFGYDNRGIGKMYIWLWQSWHWQDVHLAMTIAVLARCTFGYDNRGIGKMYIWAKNIWSIPPLFVTYFSKEYITSNCFTFFHLCTRNSQIFYADFTNDTLAFWNELGFRDEKLPFPFWEFQFGEEIIKLCTWHFSVLHVLVSCSTHHICRFLQNIWMQVSQMANCLAKLIHPLLIPHILVFKYLGYRCGGHHETRDRCWRVP
jgi:hypothetical protein